MSYVVLARKYRPQSFQEVVGQIPVSQTLLNALESGRIAHAYVFSGPRGVGKTTTARILAKCLNCVKGPTKTPCNECEACRSISENNSVDDVLEIDGASNRGIEQIRELRESAKYAPARSRYRIYIIDEAHQITKDAFGALLKTLEEPPPHVVFMMATTEVQKIPAPILSRCQRFALRPISPELVFKHLREICKKEGVKVEDAALADIVRFVEGSLRDALSLLDQAIVFAPEGITASTVRDLLGLLPGELIRRFAEKIQVGEPADLLKDIARALQDGVDLTQLAKDLQAHYHSLLLAKAGVQDSFNLNADQLAKDAAGFEFPVLERNIRLLSRAQEDMRRSDTPRAVFEIYALRLAQKTLDPREMIERLEKLESGQSANPVVARTAPAAMPAAPSWKAPAPAPKPESMVPGPSTMDKPVVKEETPGDLKGAIEAGWKGFIDEIGAQKQSLASALQGAAMKVVNGRVHLTFTTAFHQDMVERGLESLKTPFMKRFGAPLLLDTKLEKGPAPEKKPVGLPAAAGAPPAPPAPPIETTDTGFETIAEKEASPELQNALKHFGGTLKKERKKG